MDAADYLAQQREKLENRLATAVADLDDQWPKLDDAERLDRATLVDTLSSALAKLPAPAPQGVVGVEEVIGIVWHAIDDAGQPTETADLVVAKLRERLCP